MKPVNKVPTKLPEVETAYNFPAVEPKTFNSDVANLIAYGETMPNNINGIVNNIYALKSAPIRKSKSVPSIKTNFDNFGIGAIDSPTIKIIMYKFLKSDFLSAYLPPNQYPIDKQVSATVIRDAQTNRPLP